ncbi:insulin-like growth factor-binding protein complex acid labile subunit [Onthophagus taurus]|uniref:insulin-like growth factor-binding protein complex acid labile subunit n=1 Tax=Onthophagus taurus TaxID=166361 RepID=UPI0039BDD547
MFRLILLSVLLNVCLSDKCNVDLNGVKKKWSQRALSEPFETEDALSSLQDAYKITIKGQEIPVLCKGTVKGLEKLYELDMDFNGIKEIEVGAFADVVHLRDLHLNKNRLKHIKAGVFNELGISILRLGDNEIELIDQTAFDDMPNLRIIHLNNNKISAINKEWFKNTPNVHQLTLENNLITSLVEHNFKNLQGKLFFYDLPAWLNIDLSGNKIATIDPKAFDGLEELGILSLDKNEISVLHEDTFKDVGRISWINLTSNKIRCLPQHMKHILKADATFLENNPWNCTCLETLQQQLKWRRLTSKVSISSDVLKCKIDDLKSTVRDVLAEHE